MTLKWKHLFSNRSLSRGEDYFSQGMVYNLREMDGRYTATVVGSSVYSVVIELAEDRVAGMYCTCPHAAEGNNCKHMAAVIFEMEEFGYMEESNPLKPVELPLIKAEGYQYYDLQAIAATFTYWQDDIDEAYRLIDANDIVLLSVTEGLSYHSGEYEKVCTVKCELPNELGWNKNVMVQFTRDRIVYASCDGRGCRFHYHNSYYGHYSLKQTACPHVAAALMLFEAYQMEHDMGDATDIQGESVLSAFRRRRSSEQAKVTAETTSLLPTAPVRLEPRLEVEDGGILNLSFKIGDQKMYVVKSMRDLVENAEGKSQMQLGTKSFLHFGSQWFDDSSLPYYEMIRKALKADQLRDTAIRVSGRGYYSEDAEIRNSIPLYGARLDEFFEIAEGTSVPFVDKRDYVKVQGNAEVCHGSFDASLYVRKELNRKGELDGVRIEGLLPEFINGLEHRYIFEDQKLQRVEGENVELLQTLVSYDAFSGINFVVGRKHLSEFFYRILPVLEDAATVEVEDRELLEQYLYPEGKFVFYLDAEDDNVTCVPKVKYGDEVFLLSADESKTPERDAFREREVLEVAETYFPHTMDDGTLHCDSDETLIFKVLRDGVNALLSQGEVQATDRFNRLTIRRKPQIAVGVQMESDLLNLSVSSSDMTEEDLIDLLRSYRRKKNFHRLKNGDFVRLDDTGVEELSLMLDMMKVPLEDFVKGKMQIPAYRALYLDKLLEQNDSLYSKRDSNFKNLVRDFKTVSDSDYEVPESLQDIMRNYQQFGYKWLRTVEACKFGGILADDMGLGKTLQMIALLLAAKQEGRLETALVVTPASLVYNWKAEFEKFAPELNVQTVTGTKRERKAVLESSGAADVLVTSYDLLKRDIKEYEELHFSHQIIDEAQYIKTHTTAAAKSVKVIKSGIRFALTGTPIENRLSELWSIFDYLMPGFLYPYERFRNEFETPIVKRNDKAAMERLKRMVEPFILRRLKEDVLTDLPEKIEEVHYVQFEKAQQLLYDGQAAYMKKLLSGQSDDDFAKDKMRILAEITKIRQICCDPGLCFEDFEGESAKRIACLELIQSAISGEHKVLLFSQFTSLLAMVEEDLNAAGIKFYKITGETKKEDRIRMVNMFNGDDTPVFLISLKAGGTGLNLTGADIVVHFDPWWNLAAQNQATDRAHRIGQTRAVTVYKLIARNTIEEKIMEIQQQKGQLAEEILAGKDGGLMSMSKEELLGLL